MREYQVHFSFYSEEWGNFDDIFYRVMAETPFEAREIAWPLCDEELLRSNIKQFAVTWTPNMLDAGDYFYSHAADIKMSLGRLENVSVPNDKIAGDDRRRERDGERYSLLSALYTLDDVAKDLYADKGMVPPSIYEELHYTEKLCEHYGWGEKADALWERMENARKWDRGAVYTIRDMFRNGYTTLCGETELLHEHFGRNGIYPVHNKIDERDHTYISRWRNKTKVDSLVRLPYFQEKDVIRGSAGHMDCAWQILLLDRDRVGEGLQTPENQFWQPVEPPEQGADTHNGIFFVGNPITGVGMFCREENFWGILRPEFVAALDFNALKNEYAADHGGEHAGIGDEDKTCFDTGADEDEFER